MDDRTTSDFFISYAGVDERWAEWIAWELEGAGYTTVLQVWDFQPGRNFVAAMQEACAGTTRTIATLSPDYLSSRFSQPEWAAALARDPAGGNRTLVPVRVRPCDPHGLLGAIAYLDLCGLNEEACREALLSGVMGERGKPVSAPSFPGEGLRSVPEQPLFPGAARDRLASGIAGPLFRSRRARDLSRALDAAYLEQEALASAGADTGRIGRRILELRRELREGGRLQAGDVLGERFKLIETLGAGGFATVWKAFDRAEQELVAVKVLHGQFADDRTRRERFFRGARRMGTLRHPGIVPVLDRMLVDEGHYYFVMQLIDGPDLNDAVLNDPPVMEDRLHILLEVGDALQFAHDEHMVHRDIKPANILLQNRRTPKLTDFDLVHVSDTTGGTRTGMLGTVVYAAPETWMDARDASVTVDVYSFGMTCLFTLSGVPLPLEVIRDAPAFIEGLSLPAPIRAVLQRAVAWKPEDRYPTVRALCADLESPQPWEERPAPERSVRNRIVSLFERRRRRGLLQRVFSRYASPGLTRSSQEAAEMREMTVLFSAVRGMTSISEAFMPKELTEFMDTFLNPLTAVIERFGGTVDNYMADSIMAYWGGPPGDSKHAQHAVEAALQMVATADSLSAEFDKCGWPRLRIEIGINTGPMIYGRFAARGTPTVMGDAVNLSSRLEGMTRGYGVYVIAGEATMGEVVEHVFRELDTVRVKGKDRPLTIYEPLGPRTSLDPAVAEELDLCSAALEAYRRQAWDTAQERFLALQQRQPDHALYALYLERVAHLRGEPPPPDWDGVFTFAKS